MLYHADLIKITRTRGMNNRTVIAVVGSYLSECAFAHTAKKDKVKEINVAVEVDGLCAEVYKPSGSEGLP